MSNRAHSIHHINFPTTDPERTKAWYCKVFGLRQVDVSAMSNTRVLLLTRGDFDMHFTPVKEMRRMAPFHFAVEVEDWDGFMAHLDALGVRRTRTIARPQNNSRYCYITDPDRTTIEIVYHGNRKD